jgi:hypothetical protein
MYLRDKKVAIGANELAVRRCPTSPAHQAVDDLYDARLHHMLRRGNRPFRLD